MPLQFTQTEVESTLNDILKHGDKKDIAAITGHHESTIKRQFNPDDETPSCAFRLLQIACAESDIDEDRGELFWQALCHFRRQSKKRRKNDLCLNQETGKLNQEIADFVRVKLENKPFNQQLKELLEAEAQLENVKKALMDEYNRLKDAPREAALFKIIK